NPTWIRSSTKQPGIFVNSSLLVNSRRRNRVRRETPAPGSRRSSKRNREPGGGPCAPIPSPDTSSRLRVHDEKSPFALHVGSHASAAWADCLPARCPQRSGDRREIP